MVTRVYDNLSSVSGWLSDALCRLSTGAGFSTRQLYTDSDEMIFDATRPTLLTGIEEIIQRGDLLSRTMSIRLPRIWSGQRRTERELDRELSKHVPNSSESFAMR